MLTNLLRLSSILTLVWFVGCQWDDIVVETSNRDHKVLLAFQYQGSDDPVNLSTIIVQETGNGSIVWELTTYDPLKLSEKSKDKLDIAKLEGPPSFATVTISQMVLGTVPDGFTQRIPKASERPHLETGKTYDVLVVGAGHRGHGKFTKN